MKNADILPIFPVEAMWIKPPIMAPFGRGMQRQAASEATEKGLYA